MVRNREYSDIPGCAMEASLKIIGGKWKGVVLFHLLDGPMRFNELGRKTLGVTPRLLVKQLRELEEDGLVERTVYPVVPPKVEYALTEEAQTLAPLLRALDQWGAGWLDRRGITPLNQLTDAERDELREVEATAAAAR